MRTLLSVLLLTFCLSASPFLSSVHAPLDDLTGAPGKGWLREDKAQRIVHHPPWYYPSMSVSRIGHIGGEISHSSLSHAELMLPPDWKRGTYCVVFVTRLMPDCETFVMCIGYTRTVQIFHAINGARNGCCMENKGDTR